MNNWTIIIGGFFVLVLISVGFGKCSEHNLDKAEANCAKKGYVAATNYGEFGTRTGITCVPPNAKLQPEQIGQ